jgi:hypothetical protein
MHYWALGPQAAQAASRALLPLDALSLTPKTRACLPAQLKWEYTVSEYDFETTDISVLIKGTDISNREENQE